MISGFVLMAVSPCCCSDIRMGIKGFKLMRAIMPEFWLLVVM